METTEYMHSVHELLCIYKLTDTEIFVTDNYYLK